MNWKKFQSIFIVVVLILVGLACSLPSQLFGASPSEPAEVDDQVEATFEARTQQASNMDDGEEEQGPTATPATPYPDGSSTTSLSGENIIKGVDGVTVGASADALEEDAQITIERIESPDTDAELGVDTVGDYYKLSADRDLQSQADAPFFLALPIPEDVSVDNLAIALLGKKDEFHVDTEESNPEKETDAGDNWVFRPASADPENGLLVATLFNIPKKGRLFTIVQNDSFSTHIVAKSGGFALAKPVKQDNGPEFKAICHPKAFNDLNWQCTKRDREAAATLLKNAYQEHNNLGFKTPNLYYSVQIDASLPEVLLNPENWTKIYSISIADCTWMSKKWGKGTIGKYFGSKGPRSLQVCYNGNNVNWRDGNATSANFVERTIYHEYFHAVQWAYEGFRKRNQSWGSEGTARASENSASSMNRGPGGWHDLDVALDEHKQRYRAQDFWVFTGKQLNMGLDYLIPFLKEGIKPQAVDKVLKNTYGSTYPSGLSDAYWAWIKNQAFENGAGGQCALNKRSVVASGNEHALLTSNIRGPQNIKVGPLQSKVVRFNIFRLSDDPSVKYQFSLNAKPGNSKAHSKFYYRFDNNTDRCLSRSDRNRVYAIEVPESAEFTDHYVLLANGGYESEAEFNLSVSTHKYEIAITSPSENSSATQGTSINFQADFNKNGTDQGSGQIEWTLGKPLSQGGSSLGTGADISVASNQLGGVGTHDIFANYTGDPPRETIYDSVTVTVNTAEAPSVNISHPNDGQVLLSTYYGGDYDYDERNSLLFTATGSATDAKGNAITGSDLEWSYRCGDCSGSWTSIGTGSSVDVKLQDTECGPTSYQLRLKAEDKFGNTAQKIIDIAVNVTGC